MVTVWWRSVFGKPFAAHSGANLKTMVREIGEASPVETEDELDGIKQTVPAKRIRSLALDALLFLFFLSTSLSLFLLAPLPLSSIFYLLFSILVGLPFTLLRAPVLYSHGYLYSCFSRFTLGEAVFRRFCKKLAPLPPSRPSLLFALAGGVLRFLACCQKLRLSILNIRLAWEELSFHAFFGTLLYAFVIIVLSLEFFLFLFLM